MNPTKSIVILMADDDADDRLLAKDALAECHLESDLRCVENGEELLDYLQRRGKYGQPAEAPRPGLILLDLNMPRKDGREAPFNRSEFFDKFNRSYFTHSRNSRNVIYFVAHQS